MAWVSVTAFLYASDALDILDRISSSCLWSCRETSSTLNVCVRCGLTGSLRYPDSCPSIVAHLSPPPYRSHAFHQCLQASARQCPCMTHPPSGSTAVLAPLPLDQIEPLFSQPKLPILGEHARIVWQGPSSRQEWF